MKLRWQAWVRFVGERESGLVLAVFRVAVGLIAFGTILETWLYGVADLAWIDQASGGAFTLRGNWLVRLAGGPTRGVVGSLALASLLGGLAVAIGAGGRLGTFLALQAYLATISLNGNAAGGYDVLITNALWLLVIGGASSTLSLDSRLKTGAWWSPDGTVPAIARRLVVFQMLLVYATTGLHKMSPLWTPAGGYSALYWVYQEPTWRRFDMTWTASVYPLFQVATAVSWHWELAGFLMFLWYWYRLTPDRRGRLRKLANRWDLRKPYLAIGVMLHLGILMTIAVGPFSYISLAYYLAFVTPEEARRALEACARRTARSSDEKG